MAVLGPESGSLDPCPRCFPKAKTAGRRRNKGDKAGWVKILGVEKVGSCTHNNNFFKKDTENHSKRNIKVHFREEKKIGRALHGVTAYC